MNLVRNPNVVNVIMAIVAVIVAYVIYDRVVKPRLEGFGNEMRVDTPMPKSTFYDPQTGTMMDGPGWVDPILEQEEAPNNNTPANYYLLDDGDQGQMSVQHNLCSRSCCSAQWPTPFKMKHDPYVCANKDKYVPSNIMCNNVFQDAGCLCLDKDQAAFITNRGGNGQEWF